MNWLLENTRYIAMAMTVFFSLSYTTFIIINRIREKRGAGPARAPHNLGVSEFTSL